MGAKIVDHAEIRTMDLRIPRQNYNQNISGHSFAMLRLLFDEQAFRSECNRDHPKLKKESVKKSLEKSKNVLEEKRKKRSSEKFA